ncbi:hypothetical protein ACWOC1_08445 [Enterococcus quebecensis]|uniref:Uncharacterized protein n=1 Tax=Enterococcus quebecensis TaxID=903983 RepID=A0A1E5GQ16_9ENTE|nr:hypothetical protein [Enterococcus quebecensis]OEG14786.1 hypothetical protein BCR23_11870 [Enterococcus quebecensis]
MNKSATFFKQIGVVVLLFISVVVLSACQGKKDKTKDVTSKKTIETTIETKSNAATIIVEDSSN